MKNKEAAFKSYIYQLAREGSKIPNTRLHISAGSNSQDVYLFERTDRPIDTVYVTEDGFVKVVHHYILYTKETGNKACRYIKMFPLSDVTSLTLITEGVK